MPDMEVLGTFQHASTSTTNGYISASFTSIPTTYAHLLWKGAVLNYSSASTGFMHVSWNGGAYDAANTYGSNALGYQGGNPDRFIYTNTSLNGFPYVMPADDDAANNTSDARSVFEGWIPFYCGRTSIEQGPQQVFGWAGSRPDGNGTYGSLTFGGVEKPLVQTDITELTCTFWPGLTAGDSITLYGLKG